MRTRKTYFAWMFIGPSLILYLFFFIVPTIQAFKISLYKWSGFSKDMEFIGFNNFIRLVNDSDFLLALKNTLIILIVGGIGIFLLAFIFSILLGSGIRGKKIYRAIIFFPYVIAPIIHAIYWGLLVYSPRNGILNQVFKLINIDALANYVFLDNNHILASVIFVIIWIDVGYFLILLMAGIDRIPPYLYEAARIEGVNEFQLFYKITLPLVKEVLTIGIIFWGISAIKIFDLLFAFGGIEVRRELWTTSIYLYMVGFGKRVPVFDLGYASAIGVVTLLMVIIISLMIRKLIKREIYEY